MKTVIHYESKDGTIFTDKKTCEDYEKVVKKCEYIFHDLRERPQKGQNIAIRQDLLDVKIAMKCFLGLCAEILPKDAEDLLDVAYEKKDMEFASEILNEHYDKYPILFKTWLRFNYINMESGIEYDRIYYAMHEDEFKGTIK